MGSAKHQGFILFFLLAFFAFLSLRPCISIVSWNYCTSKLNYLCLHRLTKEMHSVAWLRCICWQFAVERVCCLYSVHDQSSVFSWVSIKIYPTEVALIVLGGVFRGDEMSFLALDWPWVGEFVIFIFWCRIDVNHHTCVVNPPSFTSVDESIHSSPVDEESAGFCGQRGAATLPRIKTTARERPSQCSAQIAIQW